MQFNTPNHRISMYCICFKKYHGTLISPTRHVPGKVWIFQIRWILTCESVNLLTGGAVRCFRSVYIYIYIYIYIPVNILELNFIFAYNFCRCRASSNIKTLLHICLHAILYQSIVASVNGNALAVDYQWQNDKQKTARDAHGSIRGSKIFCPVFHYQLGIIWQS